MSRFGRLGSLVVIAIVMALATALATVSTAEANTSQTSASAQVAGASVGAMAATHYYTQTVRAHGSDWPWGPWSGVTLSKKKTNTYGNGVAGAGIFAAAGYLCTRLQKLPYGTYLAAGCIGYLAVHMTQIKNDFATAKRHDRWCIQFRYHLFGAALARPSHVVTCSFTPLGGGGGGGSW